MTEPAPATRTTGTVLDRIVADRRRRLAEDRRALPEAVLEERIASLPGPVVPFADRLRRGRAASPAGARLRLVAEIKRASPSKGRFREDFDALGLARDYTAAGAAALSILTEPDHFLGSIGTLGEVRRELAAGAGAAGAADRPALLRKDFLFDPYQLLEARAYGADAVLLIVAMLDPAALADLHARAQALGMAALVEVHDAAELATALQAGATVVGVNNRDLRTFAEDLGTCERLAPLVPPAVTLVAESAVRSVADAERMAAAGAHAILVGEALVRSGDARATARALMLAPGAGAAAPEEGR